MLLASANGEQRFQSRAAITTGRGAEIDVELRPPTSSRCVRFLRFALDRPCGANDPLSRRAPPLTPVGPRRLQTTRAEGWRRGYGLILGDRRSEFRPHFAADSHDNGHNNGGEHQAHQTGHKSAHRHSDIPKGGQYPQPTDCPSWRRWVHFPQAKRPCRGRTTALTSEPERWPATSEHLQTRVNGMHREAPLVYAFDRV
jgi:hypothetical protein